MNYVIIKCSLISTIFQLNNIETKMMNSPKDEFPPKIQVCCSSSSINGHFSFQLTNIESKMINSPKDDLLPIIQVCGSSSSINGNLYSSCVYIHGVYPYFYFRPSNMKDSIFESKSSIENILNQIECKLEVAMQKYNSYSNKDSRIGLIKKKYIYRLDIQQKKCLYAYYADSFYFIKVYYYNPFDISKFVQVLMEGDLLGPVQVFEAHVSHVLQFLQDYNLYGMNWLHVRNINIRKNHQSSSDSNNCNTVNLKLNSEIEICEKSTINSLLQRAIKSQPSHILDDLTSSDLLQSQPTDQYRKMGLFNSNSNLQSGDQYLKRSTCPLECDVDCSDIINLNDPNYLDTINNITPNSFYMNSLKALWQEEVMIIQ